MEEFTLNKEEQVSVIWDLGVRLEAEGKTLTQADRFDALLKAQAKKLARWGNGECGEHERYYSEFKVARHRCAKCWEALLKSLE